MPSPSASMSLRAARDTDCSSLAALSIQVWLSTYIREGINAHFADYALAEFTTDHFHRILSSPTEHILVSQNHTGIDGYIRIRTTVCPPSDGTSDTEIATLYVQPRHQGRGVGHHLLTAALLHCQKSGWAYPWLIVNSENTTATHFYKRNGFMTRGQTWFEIQGQKYPNEILQYDAQQV